MQNIVEQLVLQEFERRIQSGDVDQAVETVVGYLMRVTPKEVSDIWQDLLAKRLAARQALHADMAHGNFDVPETT
jgi:hypothetical protein